MEITNRKSLLAAVMMIVMAATGASAKIHYVTPDGQPVEGGWQETTTLETALAQAVPGDEIWLRGFDRIGKDMVYQPSTTAGFTLKAGVEMWGGFNGTETDKAARTYDGNVYRLKYRTVLLGDINLDDKEEPVNLIFPENATKADNATHVLTIDLDPAKSDNKGRHTTVVNGVTVTRGSGVGGYGGGILVTGDNQQGGVFLIQQCFFIENYAMQGGAVAVDAMVKHVNGNYNFIDRCGFFNNAAGQRTENNNQGGAMALNGEAYVLNSTIFNNVNGGVYTQNPDRCGLLNCTVTRNTGSGIDGKGMEVYNTVIWGNTLLTTNTETTLPDFRYSAYPDVLAGNTGNNIFLDERNRAPEGPAFESPSLRTGFDMDYDVMTLSYPLWSWKPLEGTALVDKGSTELYDRYAIDSELKKYDIDGAQRISGDAIDIGAYEFQQVETARVRYVRQGATGSGLSWDDASGDLQAMIDQLAAAGEQAGEVWVAQGTYVPTTRLDPNKDYTGSFRMRDGISVYGGFEGTETDKTERRKTPGAMPWDYAAKTVLQGAGYSADDFIWSNEGWTSNSSSRHVVWFAPWNGGGDFTKPTYLDGVTVRGGYAQGEAGLDDFKTDKGAGVYMDTPNSYVNNCVVTENTAKGNGGGVYSRRGRVVGSLVANNGAGDNGGGVYVEDVGMVLRSMMANNSATLGAGIYLDNADGDEPEYLIVSTNIISNNTARKNGAVYCNNGGVLLQNTIVNNLCTTATDAAEENAAQTAAVYVDKYCMLVNSVVWNNPMGSKDPEEGDNVPVYVKNPSVEKTLFLYNAMSGVNNSVWNNTLQVENMSMNDRNGNEGTLVGPNFDPGIGTQIEGKMMESVGVQPAWRTFDYMWKPVEGSFLWASGMSFGQLPDFVLMTPELDVVNANFAQKPSIGAYEVEGYGVNPDMTTDASSIIVYVDMESKVVDGDGSSWEKPYRSINYVMGYFKQLTAEEVAGRTLEMRVREGNLYPRYAFSDNDPKTATMRLEKTLSGATVRISGGWHVEGGKAVRDMTKHRTLINGNINGSTLADGNYHAVTVGSGAKVELDGLHIVNGYAAGTATVQSGGGLLARNGSEVTVRNCIFENNTAVRHAALDASDAKRLVMENCVVNNNTNTDGQTPVVGVPADVEMRHLTVVNNIGAAPELAASESSFAIGNSAANTITGIASVGEDGARNFANPTNKVGATLGFDTYLGGYSRFLPLTSSQTVADNIINKAGTADGTIATDVTMVSPRDLGGIADKGAYEAQLLPKGRVYYVKENGDDSNDGLSWEHPFLTLSKALDAARLGEVIDGKRPQVWVAAGTYRQEPAAGSVNCFEIADGVNVYGAFPKTGTPGLADRHPFISTHVYNSDGTYSPADYETILTPQTSTGKRRVLGQSDFYNPKNRSSYNLYSYVKVEEGAGDYKQSESGWVFVGEGKGTHYYKEDSNPEYLKTQPGKGDCTYRNKEEYYRASAGAEYVYKSQRDIQARLSNQYRNFVNVGKGKGRYNIERGLFGNTATDAGEGNGEYALFEGAGYYAAAAGIATHKKADESRYYTKAAPDNVAEAECDVKFVSTPGYWDVGAGYGNYNYVSAGEASYEYVGQGNGNFIRHEGNNFYYPTEWDGFTLRGGHLDSYGLPFTDDTGKRNGGAGVAIFNNMTLKNSIVADCHNTSASTGQELRGGGVYCDEGKMINCYILNNRLGQSGQYTAYGGGVYLYQGTMYNCVINGNIGEGQHTDGAALFIENGAFFNNTVVGNTSRGTVRGNGGISIYNSGASSRLTIYNCIVLGNTGFGGDMIGDANVAVSNGGYISCYNSICGSIRNTSASGKGITYVNCKTGAPTSIFANYSGNNFRLNATSAALNMGENMPEVNGVVNDLFDFTDMDFTERIKDCTVDAGAYERNNSDNVRPQVNGNVAVYYVTQNGAGNANADSPANAACAMKLQEVLTAAGEYYSQYPDRKVMVKVAGYVQKAFVYHANTLAQPNDPQSYTFVVPFGVTLKGGYDEGTYTNGRPDGNGNWDDDNRNAAMYMTVLSAIKEASSTMQEVNGYHALTFGDAPQGWTYSDIKPTVVDGVYLEDGAAVAMSGAGANVVGGGAVVPAWAHLKNTVVRNNRAIRGGGLYVMPGALVSGCGVMQNEADDLGGGIYASADNAGADRRAHLFSNTIVENTANSGGGLYLEDGAAMTVNSVVWGNIASSDKNISGVTNRTFADNFLTSLQPQVAAWYPFSDTYVERAELPGNFGADNVSMTSDYDIYFSEYYTMKPYSQLINHGMLQVVQQALERQLEVATHDMQGISRCESRTDGNARVDVGAYAYNGGIMPLDKVVRRLFVSQSNNVVVADGTDENALRGKSFFTSLTWLEDAFDYINALRSSDNAAIRNAAMNTHFEILVAGGTYKPKYRRADAASTTVDQRQNSFVVPYNVDIYGGFSGTETISSDGITSVTHEADGATVSVSLTPDEDIDAVRSRRTRSDFNLNGIQEPWEYEGQTILSGFLNLSSQGMKTYHVVYTTRYNGAGAPDLQVVTLDGLTVMDGMTADYISPNDDEVGRGGGVYCDGLDLFVANSRILRNTGVRGGGLFVRDGNLTLLNSILGGNTATTTTADENTAFGGAAFITRSQESTGKYSIRSVNTLWTNNTSKEYGAALAVGNVSTDSYVTVNMVNNTIVRNKSKSHPVIYNGNGESHIANTLIWNNAFDITPESVEKDIRLTHCACDNNYNDAFGDGNTNNNMLLGKDNMAVDGPKFKKPSEQAGAEYYDASHLWNPVAVSKVTDAGFGWTDAEGKEMDPDKLGCYVCVWNEFEKALPGIIKYKDEYISSESGEYSRYSGPVDDENITDRTIDIGFYEYQYVKKFSTMDKIYIAEVSSGKGDGSDWNNASDDLHGAILGATHPTQEDFDRTIYVKAGTYVWYQPTLGTAFPITTGNGGENQCRSVVIKGSCTGEGEKQDFSRPSVITNEGVARQIDQLVNVSVNQEMAVTLEGFRLENSKGDGVNISKIDAKGAFAMKNVDLRMNDNGLKAQFTENGAKPVLLANVLLADNRTAGIDNGAEAQLKLVNTTFANNAKDMTTPVDDTYNSVAWNNGTTSMAADPAKANVVFDLTGTDAQTNNADVKKGPNFIDPLNTDIAARDYRIRPSLTLLNQGDNMLYTQHVLDAAEADIPDTERDLGNTLRQVGEKVDVGAYEYEAILRPIIYVKNVVGGKSDGTSWENAVADLQGAVDLAGIYAESEGSTGYVFVHNNISEAGAVSVTLPDVKVYGGMNDEVSGQTATEAVVADLIGRRSGLLELPAKTEVGGLLTVSGERTVVDGFRLNGGAEVHNGMVSTAIVEGDVAGTAEGVIYNAFVRGNVGGVKAVNVTATGSVAPATGSGNNIAAATTNRYVADDYWNYQLMETDDNINGGTVDIQGYIAMAGHDTDIAGNRRQRDNVDNGCFETWDVGAATTGSVTDDDYPHGKSVVYVRSGSELVLQRDYAAGSAFTPGFLLLEHRAGLRGNGKTVSLDNFAMERRLDANGENLAAIPFMPRAMETAGEAELKLYDAAARAAYDYKFDKTGGAWQNTTYNFGRDNISVGWLIKGTPDSVVRFVGNRYTEDGQDKQVALKRNNYSDPWNSPSQEGNRFTHKENMSWNLFGSPYLCGMNYTDMEYGRVVYGYADGTYVTVNTDGLTEGHIPAGDAVFTQTATLKDYETLGVGSPMADNPLSGEAYGGQQTLAVAVKAGDADADAAYADMVRLTAVDGHLARHDFDMAADGVKWMAEGMAQIYAGSGSGRYSMLSAVDRDGKVALGVALPEAGMYTIALPDDCDTDGYEAVTLHDAATGLTVDLLDKPYTFSVAEPQETATRFSIAFRPADGDAQSDIRVRAIARRTIMVSGVRPNDVITVYSADGKTVAGKVAQGPSEKLTANVSTVAVVGVVRDGNTLTMQKIVMPE